MAGAASLAMSIGVILFAVVLVAAAALIAWKFISEWKRNDYVCHIVGKDGFKQAYLETDVAGVYIDKLTKNKRFFLRRNNVGLNPDNIPYITTAKGQKVVYLKKIGLKNFKFISWESLFTKDEKINVGEEDVNWAVNAYERQKAVFGTSLLEKMIPYMGLIIMGVFMIGLVYFVFSKFDIMTQVLEETGKLIKELQTLKGGTTVITNN